MGAGGRAMAARSRLRMHCLATGGVALAALFSISLLPARAAQAPDPMKIVRDASWNEIHAKGHPFRFVLFKEDSKGSTVKEIIETQDGDVARLIAKDGEPLTPAQTEAERNRLLQLLAHPAIQAHRRKKEKEDSARGNELVLMLPDAFLYTYEGIVPGPSGPCYKLAFKPNPDFDPPDREGEVYHGMVGELWVDTTQLRLARIDAHLVADVNFGWGVLGKLYKGGSILVEDADVGLPFGTHEWETTLMRLNLHGKILMVKPVDFSTLEKSTDFEPVDRMGYQEAVHMLLDDKLPDPLPFLSEKDNTPHN